MGNDQVSFYNRLQFKFLLTFLIVSFVPGALFSVITYSALSDKATEESISEAHLVLNQINNTFDAHLSELQRVALIPNFDTNIQEGLLNPKIIITDKTKPSDSLYSTMNLFTQFNFLPYCSGVSIFHTDGTLFYSQYYAAKSSHLLSPLLTSPWFKAFSASASSSEFLTKREDWADLHADSGQSGSYFENWSFSFVQKLYSYPGRVYSGALVVDITKDMFTHIFNGINNSIHSQLIIYNPVQQLVLYQNSSEIPTKGVLEAMRQNPKKWEGSTQKPTYQSIDGKEILLSAVPSTRSGWIVVSMVSKDDIVKNANVILYTFAIDLCICLLLTIVLSISFARRLTNPIRQLQKSMERVEEGDLQVRYEGDRLDEIGYLGKSFNKMLVQLDKYLFKYFTLEVLRSQINPHFLYNSLGTIGAIAKVKNIPEIHTLAISLAKLFRYSINQSGRELVTFEEELDILKSYIDAQQIRFGSNISVEWDISESVYTRKTIKLTLQPLLENAFAHGIEPNGSGLIRIRGNEHNGIIHFEIEDNGVGIPDYVLRQIQEQLQTPLLKHDYSSVEKKGIGISNVHQRILLTFGQPYGLHVKSKFGEGTLILLDLPVIES
jgi:two-component system sensor histidine kinase YesM